MRSSLYIRNSWSPLLVTLVCFYLQNFTYANTVEVSIVIDSKSCDLERIAATELESMIERLYAVKAEVVAKQSESKQPIITFLIGQTATNSPFATTLENEAVSLSQQGLIIKTIAGTTPIVIIRGGSPIATLWAVYELGEQLGIRYLSDRDIYPNAKPAAWKPLPHLNLVKEPNFKVRCWRVLNEHAMGPVSWSLEETRRFLKQLVKMKFNRIHPYLWPAQPFVNYEFHGVSKGPGVMFLNWKFPIIETTIGRDRFGKMTTFTNPEFVGANSDEEVQNRSIALAQQIIQEANQLGLETDLGIMPTEWPRHFLKVIPGTQPCVQAGDLTCVPGPALSVDDPMLREMVTTIIRAYIETYPKIDVLRLSLPEHPAWYAHAQECYERLGKQYDLSQIGTFEELCKKALSRTTYPGGGKRVELWMRESLATIYLLDSLVRDKGLLKRPGGGPDIRLSYDYIPEELLPLVAQIVPAGGEAVSFIDYTASRQLQRIDLLRQPPLPGINRLLILTLGDDNVGVLPQLATGSLHQLLSEMRTHGWTGYSTRFWNLGEQDPAMHYLAHASWDDKVTPSQAYEDQVQHVCGIDAVAPAIKAFTNVEKVTQGLDQHGLNFGFPVPDMMEKHRTSGGLSEELKKDREIYTSALADMQEATSLSKPEGTFYTDYFIARLRFAVRYLDACDAFGKAGAAFAAGEKQAANQYAQAALKAIDEALQNSADVARDHGELGAVATMNEFCRKPILNLLDTLKQAK